MKRLCAVLVFALGCSGTPTMDAGTGGGGGTSTGGGTATGGGSGGGGGGATGGGTATGGGSGGGATGGGTATGGGSGGGATGGGTATGGGSGGGGGVSTANCEQRNTQCNTLVPGGAEVAATYNPGAVPTPMGGTLVNGTYHLTSSTIFTTDGGTGPTGDLRLQTIVFNAGVVQIAQREAGLQDGGCAVHHVTGAVVSTGTSPLTFTQTCPSGGSPEQTGYTAAGNTFTIYNPQQDGTVEEQIFTMQ